jgi:NAD-dependent deacetylase sirtuin 2
LAAELWPGRKYLPSKGHYFIKLLHDKGKLLRCYTQNIDSLEGMTGLPKEKIVAAHGNFDNATCVFTGKKVPVDEVRDAYLNNAMTELNKKYGTKLVKPDIVFFGESLPEKFHQLVPKDFPKCDLLIVMGTSLKVHPFASLITMVPRGTPRILVNRELVGEYPRGFQFRKGSGDVFLKGDCDDGCQRVADAIGWGEELIEIASPRL